MIPGAGGAAAVGLLLMLLGALIGVALLLWWGWRLWNKRRGTPRPPLRGWQWVLAVVLSVLPIFTALMLAQSALHDVLNERKQSRQDKLRHFTLQRAIAWGEMTLPAGSHALRELLEGDERLTGDASDLRSLTDMRFAQTVVWGEMSVNAMSLSGKWLLVELAQPYQFAAHAQVQTQNCPAGYMVQFRALKEPVVLNEVPYLIYQAQPLHLADWAFDSCYLALPIAVRYWRGGELVWTGEPDYQHEK